MIILKCMVNILLVLSTCAAYTVYFDLGICRTWLRAACLPKMQEQLHMSRRTHIKQLGMLQAMTMSPNWLHVK